ncbi:Streptococcal surface protein A (Adhesin SspS) [Durusdinium trenchii]|uniref:Streptococcal surface protein A (Adhesin SspS) n=1 Tax=Durusdinium trenchii TaxID=1381693 RepID=A0ABP0M454_9DINO
MGPRSEPRRRPIYHGESLPPPPAPPPSRISPLSTLDRVRDFLDRAGFEGPEERPKDRNDRRVRSKDAESRSTSEIRRLPKSSGSKPQSQRGKLPDPPAPPDPPTPPTPPAPPVPPVPPTPPATLSVTPPAPLLAPPAPPAPPSVPTLPPTPPIPPGPPAPPAPPAPPVPPAPPTMKRARSVSQERVLPPPLPPAAETRQSKRQRFPDPPPPPEPRLPRPPPPPKPVWHEYEEDDYDYDYYQTWDEDEEDERYFTEREGPEFVMAVHRLKHVKAADGSSVTDSPEELAAWKAMRKANFPSKGNLQRKAEMEEKRRLSGALPDPPKVSMLEKLLRRTHGVERSGKGFGYKGCGKKGKFKGKGEGPAGGVFGSLRSRQLRPTRVEPYVVRDPRERRDGLLRRLLQPDVERYYSAILQCVRYIVSTDFLRLERPHIEGQPEVQPQPPVLNSNIAILHSNHSCCKSFTSAFSGIEVIEASAPHLSIPAVGPCVLLGVHFLQKDIVKQELRSKGNVPMVPIRT